MTFHEYVTCRGPALLRLAYLLCGDRHLAEDLCQDVLIRSHARWSRLARMDNIDGYVRRMLINEFLSWRRRRTNTERPADLGAEPLDAPDAADRLAARDEAWRLLAGLPRRQRAVLVLRFYEDLSDPEIASVLDCSASTVRSQAARALARLRTSPLLAQPAPEPLTSPRSAE